VKRENVTRKDLAEAIKDKMGFSRNSCGQIVDEFFECIKSALLEKTDVKIVQFGAFKLRQKSPRIGRNPRTGETMEISERSVVTFKPSKILRAEINKDES